MWPPIGSPLKSKLMSMYLPNLDELSLRLVFALPNDSKIAFDCSSTFFTLNHAKIQGREIKVRPAHGTYTKRYISYRESGTGARDVPEDLTQRLKLKGPVTYGGYL